MNTSTVKTLILGGMAAMLALSSSACGRMADLDAPPEKQTERARRSPGAPSLPEPGTVNVPNREMPMDGGVSSPYDGPGNNPR